MAKLSYRVVRIDTNSIVDEVNDESSVEIRFNPLIDLLNSGCEIEHSEEVEGVIYFILNREEPYKK